MRTSFACMLPLFLDISSKFCGVAKLMRKRRDTYRYITIIPWAQVGYEVIK